MMIDMPSVLSRSHTSTGATVRGAAGHAMPQPRSQEARDTVSISDAAREKSTAARAGLASLQTGLSTPLLGSGAQPATNTGLRKYLDIGGGAGSTNLIAMNFSRQKIADGISATLRSAGIELRSDEKIAISVNADNEIIVGGLKDKDKARKIQEALNKNPDLAKMMRDHVAAGKINENAVKQEAYQKYLTETGQPAPDNIDEQFTSPALRNYVIDQYLGEKVGLGLADLGLDTDENGNQTITGGDESLQALLSEDPSLGATLGSIIASGDTSADFSVSFDYANGGITDRHSQDMAENKISGIRDILLDKMEAFSYKIEDTKGDPGLAAFRDVLARGFTINVQKNGEFEIVGLDQLDDRQKDTLEDILKEAMTDWANQPTNAYDGGGQRAASFKDVVDTFTAQHQFEHGDTEEYAHELEISFADGGARVVSPEADKAQHAENEQVSKQMGEALREDMEKQGIDTAGMTMEVDEKGKITVGGNLPQAELKKAQAFVDQFVKAAKDTGAAGSGETQEEDAQAAHEAGQERREMHFGKTEDDAAKAADAKQDAPEAGALDESTLTPEQIRQNRVNEAWENLFPAKQEGNHFYLGSAGSVSDIKPPRFQDDGGADATSLYRRLLNGMDNFHDKPRSLAYAA